MPFLDEATKKQVIEALAPIERDVELVVYTGGKLVLPGRDATGEQAATLELLREVAETNEHISVSERPLAGDAEAAELGISLAPTTLLREAGGDRSNIRFSGAPSGYEFQTLIEALLMLGTGETGLGAGSLSQVEAIDRPVKMQTFVTPTCPYCPRAVLTAFKFAYHNPHIVAEGIEANEFPTLSQANRISSVPDTVVSGDSETRVLGAQPDRVFVEALLKVGSAETAAPSQS